MTPTQKIEFEKLVRLVADEYKAEAASRIKWALENNWTRIAYYSNWSDTDPEFKPDDLIGFDPEGNFSFIPDHVLFDEDTEKVLL